MVNRVSSYFPKGGQPSEQLFPKRWPLSNRNRTKNNMNTPKVKRHRNSDTKNRQQRTTTKQPPWNGPNLDSRSAVQVNGVKEISAIAILSK